MTIKERFNSWVPKILGAGAITLYPFIFYRMSREEVENPFVYAFIRRHEWQHVSQVRTVGWFHFYANYLWQALTHGFKHDAISWEQDAIAHQMDSTWPENTPDHP